MNTEANTPPATPQPPAKKRSGKFLMILFLVVAVAGTILVCGMSKEEGTRTGMLTRVTKSGVIFKTYEGEMNVAGLNDGKDTLVRGGLFRFSMKSPDVYRQLEVMQGRRITVRYRQLIYGFPWQGDTDFFVYEVKSVQ